MDLKSNVMFNLPRVGLYVGNGIDEDCPILFEKLFAKFDCGTLFQFKEDQCTSNNLKAYDLIIIPGGSGSRICKALGESGKTAIKQFVSEGKKLIGICAGMYAVSSKYSWSLKMIPMQVLDTKHWRRGKKIVQVSLTEQGANFLPAVNTNLKISFANAPIIAPFPDGTEPKYTTLARYEEDVSHPEGIQGIMLGAPAILISQYKKGFVLCIGPHLEETKGLEHILAKLISSFAEMK